MPTAKLLLLILLFGAGSASAANPDSTRFAVPDVSYRTLDSLIRMNAYTALYLWPNWCTACKAEMPKLLALLRQTPGIPTISINDPDSKPYLSRSLMYHPDVFKGWYRLEPQGVRNLIRINDRGQFSDFYEQFAGRAQTARNEPIEYFFIFNRDGKLLYRNKTHLNLDTLAVLLQRFR